MGQPMVSSSSPKPFLVLSPNSCGELQQLPIMHCRNNRLAERTAKIPDHLLARIIFRELNRNNHKRSRTIYFIDFIIQFCFPDFLSEKSIKCNKICVSCEKTSNWMISIFQHFKSHWSQPKIPFKISVQNFSPTCFVFRRRVYGLFVFKFYNCADTNQKQILLS